MLRTILGRITPRKLQTRMIAVVTVLLTLLILLIAVVFSTMIAQTLRDDIGKRALAVAKTFAGNREVRDLVAANDPQGKLQALSEKVRIDSGATFVVVADKERRRFSHPDPSLIGLISQSTDSFPVLEEGKSISSLRLGATGYSIRGKTPVFGQAGQIIGYVSVGYNIHMVSSIIRQANLKIVPWIVFVIILGMLGAVWLSKRFKKAIYDLEPEEIATLLQERTTIIETIREGVLACNQSGAITLANQAALQSLGAESSGQVLGRALKEYFPGEGISRLLASGQKHFDLDFKLLDEEMIFNVSPLIQAGEQVGLVASFRRKDEMDALVKELSSVKQYAETLRAQAHEHSNSLHTIAGLIQLESYEEALELIVREETSYQGLFEVLAAVMSDPTFSALLIGKYNYARELEIDLEIGATAEIIEIPESIDRHQLVTIVGNLIDNAFDAVVTKPKEQRMVRINLSQSGGTLQIQVHDSGDGVDSTLGEQIFIKGVSNKDGAGRGIGLHLVCRAVNSLGGNIAYHSSPMGGACFSICLPLQQ